MNEIQTFIDVEIEFNRRLVADLYHLRLAGHFCLDFSPGQFVMLRLQRGTDPLLARPFSLLRADRAGFEIVYRVVGRGTALLAAKDTGSVIGAFGPLGHGFTAVADRPAIMLAGGVGMPPLYALATRMIAKGADPAKITLCYGASTESELILTDEIEKLGIDLRLSTDDGSCGHCGFATELLEQDIRQNAVAVVYACGPQPMMAAAAKICAANALDLQVSLERRFACGFGVCLGCAVAQAGGGYARACTEGPVFDANSIDWKANG